MKRFILIDKNSGFIFGDSADLNGAVFTGDAIDYARALDESNGCYGCEYEEMSFAPNDTSGGYFVFCADDIGLPVISDGQSQSQIDSVTKTCKKMGFIAVKNNC